MVVVMQGKREEMIELQVQVTGMGYILLFLVLSSSYLAERLIDRDKGMHTW